MLKIEGLKLAPGESEALLYERAARETKASASTRPPFTSCRR